MSQFIEMFDFENNSHNWPMMSFCEFASLDCTMTTDYDYYADYPHIGIDSIEQNTGRLLGYRTVKEDNVKSGKYIFTSKHIIYSKIRPNLNKVATPDFDGLCSADSYPILANEEITSKDFLAYLMRSEVFLRYIVPLSNRTGMPKVNREQVEAFLCPIPPKKEQNKFVSIYHQADKSEFGGSKSQFIEMFGATTTTVQIKDVCFVVSGKSIPTKLEDIQGNVPYIKVADFNLPGNEKYIASAQRYVAKESSEYSKMIPVGSVVFAKNGAASLSNKKRLTKIECCIDMNTMAIIPRSSEIMPEFLFAIIQAMDISAHVRQGAIPSISPKSIEDYGIVLPSTEEQNKYVTIVQQADKSEKCCEFRLAS